MKIKLGKNAYGKNAVNISKIIRRKDHDEFRQLSVSIALQGDFETTHTDGDNTQVLPTDTQKNTVYVLAKEHLTGSIEEFGMVLSNHFMNNNPQLSSTRVEIIEHLYHRLSFDEKEHPHAYISSGNEKQTTVIEHSRQGISVTSGIKDLLILKTTDSAFKDYVKDQYTTLKETDDRIMATQCKAEWIYTSNDLNFAELYARIRNSLLKTFAFHKSLSVQHTLYDMGAEVLQQFDVVKEISLFMPNKHHILFNLEQFGMENKNEVFIATDEPFGYITGTVTRE